MSRQDAELNWLYSQITLWENEYNRAKATTDGCKQQMQSEWESLHYLQERYRELKEMANEEFRSAKYCWETNDKANAKIHSINGKNLNNDKMYLRPDIDRAHARFDSAKSAFENAKAHQANILEHLKAARSAKNKRLDELKAIKAAENAHWYEKACKRCGKTIRYRDDWSHIPNYCKECKAKFDEEKKQRGKK